MAKSSRRSRRVAGQVLQYAGLYCNMEGDKYMLDEDVFNIVHCDECFLSSVNLSTTGSSPSTRYLDRSSYLSEDDTIEETNPYAFSAKV